MLSETCSIILDKGNGGVRLSKINYITNSVGYKEAEKTLGAVKPERKYYTNECQFFNTVEKKLELTLYSCLKTTISEEFEFKSDFGTYTVKLSNNLKHMTKTFELQKDSFEFQAYYQDLNVFFYF